LVIPLNYRFTGYPEVGKVKPAPTGPVAGADKCNSTGVRWNNLFVADVNIDDHAVLRLRICGHAAGRALFTICVSCDRGQRYCSPECRSEVRRQRHDANCRYQQSDEGGTPIGVVSSAIASGRRNLPWQIKVSCRSLGRRLLGGRPYASARAGVATASGLIHFPASHDDSGRPTAQKIRLPMIANVPGRLALSPS
jgi:hypothetical protein